MTADDVPHNILSTEKTFASPVFDTGEQFSSRGRVNGVSGGELLMNVTVTRRPFVTDAFQLKLTTASVAQPIACIQTFCTPGATGSRSESDTIILAVKDSMFPSPWR
jgi:hypothetical protein